MGSLTKAVSKAAKRDMVQPNPRLPVNRIPNSRMEPLIYETVVPSPYVWPKVTLFSLLCFSLFVAYDAPATMSSQLRTAAGVDNAGLGVMFSMYSIPSMITPLLAGVAVAHAPAVWATTLLMCGVSVAAAWVFLLGASTGKFWVLCAGRLLFGVAAEALYVAGDTLLTFWLPSNRMTLGFGVRGAVSELGSLLTYFCSAPLAAYGPMGWLFLFWGSAALLTCAWVGMVAAFYCFDRPRHTEQVRVYSLDGAEFQLSNHARLAWHTVRGVDGCLWQTVAQIVAFQSVFYSFCAFSPTMFQDVYGKSHEGANALAGSVSVAALFLSPLAGYALDRWGGHRNAVALCFGLSAAALVCVSTERISPWVPMTVFAASYSIIPTALWSHLEAITDAKSFPIVYGVASCAANAATAAAQVTIGSLSLHQTSAGYARALWLLAGVLAIGMVLALLRKPRFNQLNVLPLN